MKKPEDKANDIFDLIDYFAGYGFNKSHTVAYGLISYQTAYLKAHYPVQFMAALLNGSINNPDKIVDTSAIAGKWKSPSFLRTSTSVKKISASLPRNSF